MFLIEILREIGDVDVFPSDPDGNESDDDGLIDQLARSKYDCYVFLQTEYLAAKLRALTTGRFVIIPMFDGADGRPDAFWRQFVHARFISFCRAHHEHLHALGCRSAFFQFFPEPQQVPTRNYSKPTAFFWERRPDTVVNLTSVLALCKSLEITSLHVHAAPDFVRHTRPAGRFGSSNINDISITRSSWFDTREEYEKVASSPIFFFGPRLQEGIGMAVLEAMSRGQVVVSADRPTANEYIAHGTTGFLYNPAQPEIKLGSRKNATDLERMSIAARQKIEIGRADWLADIDRLKSILLDDGRRWPTRDISSHFMNSLLRSASLRADRKREPTNASERKS